MDADVSDIAKVGGGGAAATLLTLMLNRMFGSQDKVLARLDVMQASLFDLSQKLAVLVATTDARAAELSRLQATVAEHEKQLAEVTATLRHISEGR